MPVFLHCATQTVILKSSMKNDIPADQLIDLYPLDTYIKSIWPFYEYGSAWTPAQAEAVTDYLSSKLSDDAYSAFVENLYWEVSGDTRPAQVQSILASHDPWDLRGVSHDAAVQSAPSLDLLMANEIALDQSISLDDVGWWLYKNATLQQRNALLREISPGHPTPPLGGDDTLGFVDALVALRPTPNQLRRAWRTVQERYGSSASASTAGQVSSSAVRAWARAQ